MNRKEFLFRTVSVLSVVFFLVMFLLFLSACKTTGQTSREEIRSRSDVSSDVSSQKTETSNESATETHFDAIRIDESVEETIVNVKFSVPDSAGNQYPAEQTTVTRNKKTGTGINSVSGTTGQKETETSLNRSDKSMSKTDAESVITSEKTTRGIVSVYGSEIIAFVIMVLFAGICYLLHRLKILKW